MPNVRISAKQLLHLESFSRKQVVNDTSLFTQFLNNEFGIARALYEYSAPLS